MHYIKVVWTHGHPDEPVLLYSELDDERWETRKVYIYRDSHAEYADALQQTGSTRLSIEPVPELAEIASDSQFQPTEIGKEEFERIWLSACNFSPTAAGSGSR